MVFHVFLTSCPLCLTHRHFYFGCHARGVLIKPTIEHCVIQFYNYIIGQNTGGSIITHTLIVWCVVYCVNLWHTFFLLLQSKLNIFSSWVQHSGFTLNLKKYHAMFFIYSLYIPMLLNMCFYIKSLVFCIIKFWSPFKNYGKQSP